MRRARLARPERLMRRPLLSCVNLSEARRRRDWITVPTFGTSNLMKAPTTRADTSVGSARMSVFLSLWHTDFDESCETWRGAASQAARGSQPRHCGLRDRRRPRPCPQPICTGLSSVRAPLNGKVCVEWRRGKHECSLRTLLACRVRTPADARGRRRLVRNAD